MEQERGPIMDGVMMRPSFSWRNGKVWEGERGAGKEAKMVSRKTFTGDGGGVIAGASVDAGREEEQWAQKQCHRSLQCSRVSDKGSAFKIQCGFKFGVSFYW